MFKDEEEISVIDGNFEGYLRRPSEKNGYIFQEEQMDKHVNRILEIFGFKMPQKISYRPKDNIRKIVYEEKKKAPLKIKEFG